MQPSVDIRYSKYRFYGFESRPGHFWRLKIMQIALFVGLGFLGLAEVIFAIRHRMNRVKVYNESKKG